jgi:hypothetical protein
LYHLQDKRQRDLGIVSFACRVMWPTCHPEDTYFDQSQKNHIRPRLAGRFGAKAGPPSIAATVVVLDLGCFRSSKAAAYS